MKKDTKFLLLVGGALLLVYFVGRKKALAADASLDPATATAAGGGMTPHATKKSGVPEDPHLESWMLYHYGQSAKPSDKLWSDPFSQPVDESMNQEDFLEGRL